MNYKKFVLSIAICFCICIGQSQAIGINVSGAEYSGEFGLPQDDPCWLDVLDNFIAILAANNISGTYWNYTYRTSGEAHWWPEGEKMSIIPIQGWGILQLDIISKYSSEP